MTESHYLYKEKIIKVGDRVVVKFSAKIQGHTLQDDPKYNPWGVEGTVIRIWNEKMPSLPYIVKWDTGYTNSYEIQNLTRLK
jgi:hypothetical protein